ncbi:putative NIT2-nitrilase [Thelephora ganbajun]|uniref:NIT2-nitrilase n=1 Tax=Thelephora ganbajun TaxID=370292 RepID=A0ACB6ZWX6_THEGA|nr:putative NIT2-nitrilase [Thelephora ganbajun]
MVLVAAGQFCAKAVFSKNLEAVSGIITDAAKAGARMIFLPEASDFIAKADEVASLTKPLAQNEFVQGVRAKAKEIGVWVSVGVHETSSDPKRGFNSHLLIDSSGDIVSNYHKIHLFDVDIPGGTRLMESGTTVPGDKLHDPVETPAGKLGLLTCYDIRFPEAAQVLRTRGAGMLAYPSAFMVRTGAAHWEILLRSRAIETQTYVIGAAAVGQHTQTRVSWGHAMIVDPWGTVLAQCNDVSHEPTFCLANVDLDSIRTIRVQMPVDKQRRTDIYPTL